MRREKQEGRNAGGESGGGSGGVPGVNAAGKAGRQECWR